MSEAPEKYQPPAEHLAYIKRIGDEANERQRQRDAVDLKVKLIDQAIRTGGIVDCTGGVPVVRKVIGAMPVTKDGVVVSVDSDVYAGDGERLTVFAAEESLLRHFKDGPPENCEYVGFYPYYEPDTGYWEFSIYDIRDCFSTPEAAKVTEEVRDDG